MEHERSDSAPAGARQFTSTHWSVVMAAGRDDTQGKEAFGRLYRTYWRPLYFFVRRQGHSAADAQDLTQEFFARLLEKNGLGSADPAKGRFRSFLLTAMRHFLVNEWKRSSAQKRGGGLALISLDAGSAETHYEMEPVDNASPEKLFDREWAWTLLEEVLNRLKAEQERAGKLDQFNALRGCMIGDQVIPYRELASQLRTTEDALRMAVHRLRKRYGALLREEIARTVSNPQEIDAEIQHLMAALGNR
jgi:RNA polymerase sigma factor (sigma-70 family)